LLRHKIVKGYRPTGNSPAYTDASPATALSHGPALKTPPRRRSFLAGFTLVELLVVIAIIGVLVAMLLPAVQAAREAARRGTCQNHLRQFAIAMQTHHEQFGRFPTGGWSYLWTGDADRGTDRDQPSGWLYNVLPYVEESAVHDLGKGLTGDAKRQAAAQMAQTVVGVAYCPSRRAAALYPFTSSKPLVNAEPSPFVMKTDYAASAGDIVTNNDGPTTLDGVETHDWKNASDATGLLFARSEIRIPQITDGTSKTYAVGEKRVQFGSFEKTIEQGGPFDWGDDGLALVGHGTDVARFADATSPLGPDSATAFTRSFGSAHPTGCGFAMADGSVQWIAYDIDPELHRRNANRADESTTTE
jgi:prepilin-type N-terminal cleavage/methylation domain-containing protein